MVICSLVGVLPLSLACLREALWPFALSRLSISSSYLSLKVISQPGNALLTAVRALGWRGSCLETNVLGEDSQSVELIILDL